MAAAGSFSFALNEYVVDFVHFNMETKTVDAVDGKSECERKKREE